MPTWSNGQDTGLRSLGSRFDSSRGYVNSPGDASRLVPAAALKAVGVRPCAFDSRRLRHAPLAEWLSTGPLTRGGQFDSDAAYHLPPVAQRTEHPGPNGTVARSSRARRTLRDGGAVVLRGLMSHARAGSNPAPATFR